MAMIKFHSITLVELFRFRSSVRLPLSELPYLLFVPNLLQNKEIVPFELMFEQEVPSSVCRSGST
jgi:hypothetical protein